MKKVLLVAMVSALVLLGRTLPGEAWHEHGRVFIGPGFWGPPVWVEPYPYPVYGTPPPVVVEPMPAPAYVEPALPPVRYFCEDPRGYYPQVPQCPVGWKQVAPAPPAGQ